MMFNLLVFVFLVAATVYFIYRIYNAPPTEVVKQLADEDKTLKFSQTPGDSTEVDVDGLIRYVNTLDDCDAVDFLVHLTDDAELCGGFRRVIAIRCANNTARQIVFLLR